MTLGLIAFLVGLFGVPLVLLRGGHRLRRRSPRAQSMFWGAIVGHCVAGVLAIVFGMIPPEAWTADERLRGFAGLWSLLALPLGGALVGAAAARKRRP